MQGCLRQQVAKGSGWLKGTAPVQRNLPAKEAAGKDSWRITLPVSIRSPPRQTLSGRFAAVNTNGLRHHPWQFTQKHVNPSESDHLFEISSFKLRPQAWTKTAQLCDQFRQMRLIGQRIHDRAPQVDMSREVRSESGIQTRTPTSPYVVATAVGSPLICTHHSPRFSSRCTPSGKYRNTTMFA